ncbi:CYFA0S14e01640g1_1 [Cyberlindnera fabianii]|uniref:cAMP-dependent protein kinase regulatory subunit n=1 Tax=Cyberlindnera fabianii TaxID=36022 RepID=A0A061B8S1_CYBFA|nr:cAMP-dependent protein kinase regulatory subunit [Cyberlindnera fabianii]CDR44283.1 CYFA0S14e01640g1_1 [Cyberlindnera fabianii]
MSLPKDYVTELNELNKEVLRQQPADVLQFCANYFLGRLEEQRKHQWGLEPKARTLGISLFPQRSQNSGSTATPETEQQPLFKQPFGDNDPHTRADDEDPSAPGLFKTDFAVGGETGGHANTTVDPIASEPFRRSSVTTPQSVNIPSSFNANRRTSVSAETLNPNGIHDDWKAPVIPKTAEQLARLSVAVARNFLFSALDADSLSTVIGALKEVKLTAGSEVIKQGDEGDYFYVLEEGKVSFLVDGTEVASSGPGSSFGELALMYNSPRAATVLAETDVTLWALDRLTFRRILLAKTSRKRQMYESFLKEVPVLSRLSSYERSKLADALETESYKPGEVIIKEGEVGENFYLIENGEAEVSKSAEGVLTKLKRGDYFGEVALLNDTPRQASVIATTAVEVATLGKSGFQRLLGPAVEVLKRQDPTKH